MVRILVFRLFLLLAVVCGINSAFAQTDPLLGHWFNDKKSAKIQVYKGTDNKYYGKIVWLQVPNTPEGKPKTDANNPDKTKRDKPVIGLVILKGFEKDGTNTYEDGTVYDPKNGKTYDCKLTLNGSKLDVRGYVGVSLIGRTTTWTRAD